VLSSFSSVPSFSPSPTYLPPIPYFHNFCPSHFPSLLSSHLYLPYLTYNQFYHFNNSSNFIIRCCCSRSSLLLSSIFFPIFHYFLPILLFSIILFLSLFKTLLVTYQCFHLMFNIAVIAMCIAYIADGHISEPANVDYRLSFAD
jgi:hypothetical protein